MNATTLALRLARRELSAEALVRDCLARMAEREPAVRAFACLDAEGALGIGNCVQGKGGLTRRLWSVNLNNSSAR
jgi:Asp-tRNA(Asn)/Glu-tRNA(Gln) amidotransferase A subunit family amidase